MKQIKQLWFLLLFTCMPCWYTTGMYQMSTDKSNSRSHHEEDFTSEQNQTYNTLEQHDKDDADKESILYEYFGTYSEKKPEVLAKEILADINTELHKNKPAFNLKQYIMKYQNLQREEAINRDKSPISTPINLILKGLCQATLTGQKLQNHYNDIITMIANYKSGSQKNSLITEINEYINNIKDINNEEKISLLNALAQYYTNDDVVKNALDKFLNFFRIKEEINLDKKKPSLIIPVDLTTVSNDYEILVNTLTQYAYVTPALQYDALKAIGKPFEINIETGVPENLPTAQEIIDSPQDKELKLKGLQAVLEATYIAWTAAELDVAYDNPGYRFWAPRLESGLNKAFNDQIGKINTALQMIQPNIFSQAALATYELFFQTGQIPTKENMHVIKKTEKIYELPENLIKKIIKRNNFTQQLIYEEAANLLFKQCFIMQQARLQNHGLRFLISKQGDITQTNYIYTNFPNINHMCNWLKKQVTDAQKNNVNFLEIKEQVHELLLVMRESLQIALYIANKNSSFNQITNYFTSFFTRYNYNVLQPQVNYLDGVTQQLLTYDQMLAELCKDPTLGATGLDAIRQDTVINVITTIVSGAVVASITFASLYATYKGAITLYNVVNTIPSFFTSSKNDTLQKSLPKNTEDQQTQTGLNILKSFSWLQTKASPPTQTETPFSDLNFKLPTNVEHQTENTVPPSENQNFFTNTAQAGKKFADKFVNNIYNSVKPKTQ